MLEKTALAVSLAYLRWKGADEAHPVSVVHICTRRAPGLIEVDGYKAWLTPEGWELAERIIAAADDQLYLWKLEQAGTLTPEQAEKRYIRPRPDARGYTDCDQCIDWGHWADEVEDVLSAMQDRIAELEKQNGGGPRR